MTLFIECCLLFALFRADAETLMRQGRHEASLSLLMKTHRQRQEVLGRYHHKVLESQVSGGRRARKGVYRAASEHV